MRIKEQVTDIDYTQTKEFFRNRAGKFKEDNPYSVTMYQDNNQKLVEERNDKEVRKLLPFLCLNQQTKILDIACGIGRWADVLPEDIAEYCGIDFSRELIQIANKRNSKKHFYFLEGGTNDIEVVLKNAKKDKYNVILMIGILMYVNDKDILDMLEQVERISDENTTILIREPIGIKERLTLKDFFSEELKDNYNAIYRSRDELMQFFEQSFINKGFRIIEEGFLFEEDTLNNRKETAQYYYILER